MHIALSGICGAEDIICPLTPKDEEIKTKMGIRTAQNFRYLITEQLEEGRIQKPAIKQFFNHMPASMIQNLVGNELWDSYYKFAFDRNPFDKVVSFYHWRKRKKEVNFNSISEMIKMGELKHIQGYQRYSIDSLVAVDDVFKYEEMEQGLQKISQILDLDIPLKLPDYRAKSMVRPASTDYRDILSDGDRRIIEIVFAREIKLLGYQF